MTCRMHPLKLLLILWASVLFAGCLFVFCGCASAKELSGVRAEVEAMRVDMIGVQQTVSKETSIRDISIDGGAAVMMMIVVVAGGSVSTVAYLGWRKARGGRFGPSVTRGDRDVTS